jgi:hypothetical protein
MGPKETEVRIGKVNAAWKKLAPAASFAKMTYPQFSAKIKTSLDARDLVKDLEMQLADALNQRNDADRANMPVVKQVVKSVSGDVDYGSNSSLWEEMGFVRDSEKKTGLTRKTAAKKT